VDTLDALDSLPLRCFTRGFRKQQPHLVHSGPPGHPRFLAKLKPSVTQRALLFINVRPAHAINKLKSKGGELWRFATVTKPVHPTLIGPVLS
jgi:hypothetical protein